MIDGSSMKLFNLPEMPPEIKPSSLNMLARAQPQEKTPPKGEPGRQA